MVTPCKTNYFKEEKSEKKNQLILAKVSNGLVIKTGEEYQAPSWS